MCIEACSLSQVHPAWQNLSCPLSVRKATIQVLLLTQRYPLTASQAAGCKQRDTCPLCNEEPEDTEHFLLQCTSLAQTRLPYLQRILETCREAQLSIDPGSLVCIVLDSNHLPGSIPGHQELCRNFVYKMHHKRSLLLGGGSAYRLGY